MSRNAKPPAGSKQDSAGSPQGQRRGLFVAGVSGNPNGRPPGSRNRATLAAEAMMEGGAEDIIRKLIELAGKGNLVAIKLYVDRVIPALRERPISQPLTELSTATTPLEKLAVVWTALADGRLRPSEADALVRVINAEVAAKAAELEQRVADNEARIREIEVRIEEKKAA